MRVVLSLCWIAGLGCLVPTTARAADGPARYERRWVYASFNLQVDKSADDLIALIERASRAGYNGLVLADYKLSILDRVTDGYFKNAARVREAASKQNIEIIPSVFPIGYSNGLLAHDPNLAEGMPVIRSPYLVKRGEGILVPYPAATYRNGDLEDAKGDTFAGIGYQDEPGKASFADHAVAHHGRTSCRMQDIGKASANGLCRLIQKVKVRPHACYRLSCWAKTQDFSTPSAFRLLALGADANGRPLTFHEGGIEPTMDWKRLDVVFNSLDQTDVNLYVGVWGGATGTLWIDEIALEELPLVNVLRRPGCPLEVTSQDGKVTYTEGKDFEPVVDPKLGQVPWAGEYESWHDGASLRITKSSRIKEGQTLLVDWYHPVLTHGFQVMCCLSEAKVYDLLRDQAKRVNDLFHPKTFFMSHDEIRVAKWCHLCQSRKMTPGALLAENVRRCTEILGAVNPKADVLVWSDMFDPNHNAVDHYYLVNGTLDGSWKGLGARVSIANWNSGKAKESLTFFAKHGHTQLIAGYYDVDGLSGFTPWDAAARGVPKVDGFMYTTWSAKYRLLETYGKAMEAAR